jgi:hypothetical protein
MLTNLLPGLRELRTPLAVGWTLLAALWVGVGTFLPDKDKATGLLLSVYRVGNGLGRATVLGTLAFIAYLVGSLAELNAGEWLFRLPGNRGGRASVEAAESHLARRIRSYGQELNLQHKNVDAFSILAQVFEPYALGIRIEQLKKSRGSAPKLEASVAQLVLWQDTQLETRLLAEKREVYDYYDRLKESADLRVNLALAVALFGTATAFRFYIDHQAAWICTIAFLGGLGIAVALLLRGSRQYGRSREALATAVAAGIIKSPILEEWETTVQFKARRDPSPGTQQSQKDIVT